LTFLNAKPPFGRLLSSRFKNVRLKEGSRRTRKLTFEFVLIHILATKSIFDTEGFFGFLRVLLEILDQGLYLSLLGPSKHDCCDSPPIPHQRLYRCIAQSECDEVNAKKKVQTIIAHGTGYKKVPKNGSNSGEVRLR
jgi:hypothetical protein